MFAKVEKSQSFSEINSIFGFPIFRMLYFNSAHESSSDSPEPMTETRTPRTDRDASPVRPSEKMKAAQLFETQIKKLLGQDPGKTYIYILKDRPPQELDWIELGKSLHHEKIPYWDFTSAFMVLVKSVCSDTNVFTVGNIKRVLMAYAMSQIIASPVNSEAETVAKNFKIQFPFAVEHYNLQHLGFWTLLKAAILYGLRFFVVDEPQENEIKHHCKYLNVAWQLEVPTVKFLIGPEENRRLYDAHMTEDLTGGDHEAIYEKFTLLNEVLRTCLPELLKSRGFTFPLLHGKNPLLEELSGLNIVNKLLFDGSQKD